ncbi:MAG: hypothetical protein PHQ76_03575 [Caldisericia bacterium]|nr:hypothetical protein [Caldisericia bacterium]MDD5689342.1 hypothetical protein [Caldisericia bacterium]
MNIPKKTTKQIVFEFYVETEDYLLDILFSLIFQKKTKSFLHYALNNGYIDIQELLYYFGKVIQQFMEEHWYDDNIKKADISEILRCKYHYVA